MGGLFSDFHRIVQLCQKEPTTPSLMCKFDVKSAYCRLHNTADVCFQSIISAANISEMVDMVIMALRMTFGNKPGPAIFRNITDWIVDLVKSLMKWKNGIRKPFSPPGL